MRGNFFGYSKINNLQPGFYKNNTILGTSCVIRVINERPTLVFPDTNSALLICGTFNQKKSELSKWACFMPEKTKVGRSFYLQLVIRRW